MYQIWRIYLDLWGHDCKKWVWPTFGCKLGQSDPIVMQLKLDMSCHLLNVYTKFQIDISKHEEKSGKRGQTDGRTDRRTDGHCHGIIRPFFKRAYKNNTGHYLPMPYSVKQTTVNPLLTQWGYHSLALSHRYVFLMSLWRSPWKSSIVSTPTRE